MDGIKRRLTEGEGGPPPRRLVSFRNTVKSIIHSEAVMRALKHYAHRSDSEQSEDDEPESIENVEQVTDGRKTETVARVELETDGRESVTVSNNDSAFSSTLVSPSSDGGTTDTICRDEVINPIDVSAANEARVSDKIVAGQENTSNEPYFIEPPLLNNPPNFEGASSLLEEVPLLVENESSSETSVSVERPGVEHDKSLSETSVSVERPGVEHDKSLSETSVSVERPGVEHDKSLSETSVSIESSNVDHTKPQAVSIEEIGKPFFESVGPIESPSANDIKSVSNIFNTAEPSNLEQNWSQGEASVLVEHDNQQPTTPETEMDGKNEQIQTDSNDRPVSQESAKFDNPKDKPPELISIAPETPNKAAVVCTSASVPHTTDVEQLGVDIESPEVVGKEQSLCTAVPLPISDLQRVDNTFDSSSATTKPSMDNHDHEPPTVPSCTVVSSSQGFVNGSVGKLDGASHRPDAEGDNILSVESDCDRLLSCKAPNDSATAVIDGELDIISTEDDDKTDRPTDSLLPNAAGNESPKNHRVSSDDADCQCCCVQ